MLIILLQPAWNGHNRTGRSLNYPAPTCPSPPATVAAGTPRLWSSWETHVSRLQVPGAVVTSSTCTQAKPKSA